MRIIPPPIGKKKKEKRAPRTIKEKKFAKIYLKTGNATEAAAQVYDVSSRDSANAIGAENLAKLSFPELMDKLGIDDTRLLDSLGEGLTAEKAVTPGSHFIPDHATRFKFVEAGLKLRDRFPANKNETKVDFKGMIAEAQKYVTP